MRLTWTEEGWEDFASWLNDAKMTRRICLILKDIKRSLFEGIGRPEELKHELSGWWSREIDGKNRIVYFYDEDNDSVIIARCRGHYSDK